MRRMFEMQRPAGSGQTGSEDVVVRINDDEDASAPTPMGDYCL